MKLMSKLRRIFTAGSGRRDDITDTVADAYHWAAEIQMKARELDLKSDREGH